jgi:hypothetical protein
MLATFLNRLGIVLNFLAGFMVAPELIGSTRLARLQSRLDKNLPVLHRWLGIRLSDNSVVGTIYFSILVIIGCVVQTLGMTGVTVLGAPLYGFVGGISFMVTVLFSPGILLGKLFRKLGRPVPVFVNLLLIVCCFSWSLGFVVIGGWVFVFITLVEYWIPKLLVRVIGRLLPHLGEDTKFRELLVSGGIAAFILGNFLQLLATYF